MLKKVVYGIVAGSLLSAAQVASADDAQFWTGKAYQGVSALPFETFSTEARHAVAPKAAPQIDRETPQASAVQMATVPAPYNTGGGYFN
jgi:hypothetical protein